MLLKALSANNTLIKLSLGWISFIYSQQQHRGAIRHITMPSAILASLPHRCQPIIQPARGFICSKPSQMPSQELTHPNY